MEKEESVIKEIVEKSKELLEKFKSKAQSKALTRVKIARAAGNAGEDILRSAENEKRI
jgi:hypothetical protein